jgi:phosphate transport system permease protein
MNLLERVRTCRFKRVDSGTAEKIVEKLLLIAALSSTFIVFFIIAFMFKEGIPALALGGDFFFGMIWSPSHNQYGIVPLVISTFIVGIGALVIAAVIGIPAAIYLAEFSPAWLRNIIKPCVEMLVGIPSIVLGFLGLIMIVTYIRDTFGGYGECILAGWIILAIMTLPHVISISEDSIRAVPKGYKEGSLALGATQLQTIKKVILPNARSGILAAMVLGMGNAIGETMAVLMVIGNPEIPFIPSSILDALFALGVVLFIVVAILNLITTAVVRKGAMK